MKKVILLIAIFISSCGFEGKEFRPGYEIYVESEGFELVEPLFNNVIDFWNEAYGECPYEVGIILRKEHWFYYGQEIAGLFLGRADKCVMAIGIHHTSECETARVFWHELYHCCFDDYDHFTKPGEEDQIYALDRLPEGTNNWTYGLTYMAYDFRDAGFCEVGDTELYDPYPFK